MHSITLRELVQLRLIVKLGVIDNFLYLGYILIREQWLRKLLREKERRREERENIFLLKLFPFFLALTKRL